MDFPSRKRKNAVFSLKRSDNFGSDASIHESAGLAGFAIRLFGEVAKKFDNVAILP